MERIVKNLRKFDLCRNWLIWLLSGQILSILGNFFVQNFFLIWSVVAEIINFRYFKVAFLWRLSSLKSYWILVRSSELQFKIWGRSDQWLLRYSTFNILRSSSFQAFSILVWSPELKFEIWGRSDQWLLRYSTFNILR